MHIVREGKPKDKKAWAKMTVAFNKPRFVDFFSFWFLSMSDSAAEIFSLFLIKIMYKKDLQYYSSYKYSLRPRDIIIR